jgi:hypothetical protein
MQARPPPPFTKKPQQKESHTLFLYFNSTLRGMCGADSFTGLPSTRRVGMVGARSPAPLNSPSVRANDRR